MRRVRRIGAALRFARRRKKMALLDAVFVPNTRNHAQTLSTIYVDKVVHSLRKMNLSGPRKRLFCHCPKFEPTFLCI
jgi:hypothetical protein